MIQYLKNMFQISIQKLVIFINATIGTFQTEISTLRGQTTTHNIRLLLLDIVYQVSLLFKQQYYFLILLRFWVQWLIKSRNPTFGLVMCDISKMQVDVLLMLYLMKIILLMKLFGENK